MSYLVPGLRSYVPQYQPAHAPIYEAGTETGGVKDSDSEAGTETGNIYVDEPYDGGDYTHGGWAGPVWFWLGGFYYTYYFHFLNIMVLYDDFNIMVLLYIRRSSC